MKNGPLLHPQGGGMHSQDRLRCGVTSEIALKRGEDPRLARGSPEHRHNSADLA